MAAGAQRKDTERLRSLANDAPQLLRVVAAQRGAAKVELATAQYRQGKSQAQGLQREPRLRDALAAALRAEQELRASWRERWSRREAAQQQTEKALHAELEAVQLRLRRTLAPGRRRMRRC